MVLHCRKGPEGWHDFWVTGACCVVVWWPVQGVMLSAGAGVVALTGWHWSRRQSHWGGVVMQWGWFCCTQVHTVCSAAGHSCVSLHMLWSEAWTQAKAGHAGLCRGV
jgi:hypothetical protein